MGSPAPYLLLQIPLLAFLCIASACAGANERGARGDAGPQARTGDAGGPACRPCVVIGDCNAVDDCVLYGGSAYCAPTCTAARPCSPDHFCTSASSVSGARVDVCVPRSDVCGASPGPAPTSGSVESIDAGGQVTGHVGAAGGRVSKLYFVVVGDTRPASVDDTGAYPTAIIGRIFRDVASLTPAPLFGVSTGDYMFATARGGQAARQLDLYLYARATFPGIMFPAMGNHECTGATASNCGPGNADGTPDNYGQFLAKMLQPIGQSKPYYDVDVNSSGGTWTAKFVFVAPNAWDDAQAAWYETTLSRATTYTFIVRHEPKSATAAPGVGPAEQIQSRHPYTLLIAGHSHTYTRSEVNEVIIGNGGAPLTSNRGNYGFGLVEQRSDGAIQVDVVDYATMRRDTSFAFAIKADGTAP